MNARTRRLPAGPVAPTLPWLALPNGRVSFVQTLLVLLDPTGTAP
jgi:hypothetical protein